MQKITYYKKEIEEEKNNEIINEECLIKDEDKNFQNFDNDFQMIEPEKIHEKNIDESHKEKEEIINFEKNTIVPQKIEEKNINSEIASKIEMFSPKETNNKEKQKISEIKKEEKQIKTEKEIQEKIRKEKEQQKRLQQESIIEKINNNISQANDEEKKENKRRTFRFRLKRKDVEEKEMTEIKEELAKKEEKENSRKKEKKDFKSYRYKSKRQLSDDANMNTTQINVVEPKITINNEYIKDIKDLI